MNGGNGMNGGEGREGMGNIGRAGAARLLALQRERLRRAAGDDLTAFITYMAAGYRAEWFHRLVAAKCEALVRGTLGRDRLMVFMPPQHGKSEIISKHLPAWALGRTPGLKVAAASYSAAMARKFSAAVQNAMAGEAYRAVFPGVRMGERSAGAGRRYARTADYFDVVGTGGFYKAVGVGGSLTGTTVDLGIIDDPVKGIDAYSETMRGRLWDWYTDVFLTRLHRGSKVALIMTRWHEDDLAGRILAAEGGRWEVVAIPAVREATPVGQYLPGAAAYEDPRAVGEALWPAMHPLEELRGAARLSPSTFHALYQQHPTAEGGNIVRRAWLPVVPLGEFEQLRRGAGAPMVFFLDTAYTADRRNDPSGIVAACRAGGVVYIAHAEKVYKTFPDLIRWVPAYAAAHGYTPRSTVRVEPKANGLSVIDQLRRDTGLNVARTPTPREGKTARLHAATPAIEGGRVKLVEGAWNEGFVEEVCGFPAAAHDEYVDCLCYAVDYFLGGGGAVDTRRIEGLAF